MTRANTSRRSRLQTLARSLALLKQFTHDRPEWGLSELARQLKLSKAIVHRIVATLEDQRFLARKDGRYALGPAILDLSSVLLNSIDLREVARPVMKRLADQTDESVFMTILSGDRSVCVEKVDSRQRMRLTLDIGGHYPLHAGASNKVLLAFLPEEEQERILTQPLKAFTERTPRDPAQLREELKAIRQAGWCASTGELTPHAAAIAMPLRDAGGEVVGALSVSGPESRMQDKEGMVELLQRAADEIAEALVSWQSITRKRAVQPDGAGSKPTLGR